MGPTCLGGPERILDLNHVDVVAPGAFEGPPISAIGRGRDACKHHPAHMALWTVGPLDRKKRRQATKGGIWHVRTPLDQAGAQHSQSPMKVEHSAVMADATPNVGNVHNNCWSNCRAAGQRVPFSTIFYSFCMDRGPFAAIRPNDGYRADMSS